MTYDYTFLLLPFCSLTLSKNSSSYYMSWSSVSSESMLIILFKVCSMFSKGKFMMIPPYNSLTPTGISPEFMHLPVLYSNLILFT